MTWRGDPDPLKRKNVRHPGEATTHISLLKLKSNADGFPRTASWIVVLCITLHMLLDGAAEHKISYTINFLSESGSQATERLNQRTKTVL